MDDLARIAWKYYQEGMTQQEIADEYGVSRFKIMNMISDAREKGLIRIQFVSPDFNCLSMEAELKSKYGLKDAVVIPTPRNKEQLKQMLGIAGSNYLQQSIRPGDILGTVWGGTVFEVAEYFPPRQVDNTTVVLLLGGLTNSSISLNPFDVAQKFADKLNSPCYYIFAPAVVDTEVIHQAIISDRKVKEALKMARSVNKALIGIGDVSEQATLVRTNFISPVQMEELRGKGAVGDILGRYFDINGQEVECEINKRIVGVELEKIREIENVIAVAGGEEKFAAIKGALKGGYLDVLITDEDTAEGLLAD